MAKEQKLSGFALELSYRCEVFPIFVKDGFIPFMPEYDEGIDFILYRERDDLLIKVQQKGRWYVDRKYINRKIAILFRHKRRDSVTDEKSWFMVPHSKLLDAAEAMKHLDTSSWHRDAKPTPKIRDTHDQFGNRLKGAYGGERMGVNMEKSMLNYDITNLVEREHIYQSCSLQTTTGLSQ